MSENTFKSHEETVADVLGRWSVQDLVEQSDADLYVGDARFYSATGDLNVLEKGEVNLIKYWKVQSGDHVYVVQRFKNFVYCSCPSFFYRKRCCKHIALSTRVYCANCFVLPAEVGKLCNGCHSNKSYSLRQ